MQPTQAAEATPDLRRALGYRKFARDTLRIVVIDSGYHLQSECAQSLRALGHSVRVVECAPAQPFQVFLTALLRALAGFKPDFVLAVNHLGFDTDGALGRILDGVHMPIAIWYVDSPLFVLRTVSLPAPNVSTLFVWEDAYCSPLKAAGVQDVQVLPLAAGGQIVRHTPAAAAAYRPELFVGDSMQHAERKWRRRIPPQAQASCAALVAQLLANRQHLLQLVALGAPDTGACWDLLALATFRATGIYRKKILGALDAAKLHIIGDDGWRRLVPKADHAPPVAYGADLANAFRSAHVNINATSLQMPSAVNQRVFDVPAAGAFLVTDAQSAIGQHFDLPREKVIYDSCEEALALCTFYSRKPALRTQITGALRAQILARHTYAHRTSALVAHMRRRHGAPCSRS